jgi:tetratricopeptide (TPR) repeat protein
MPEASSSVLLLNYFEDFLKDRDVEAFRARVLARYTEGTLARLLQSGTESARRAAVVALGLIGSYESNSVVARSLRDRDPVVRRLAQNALWAIWFRADTPENNAELDRVRLLLNQGLAEEAILRATTLIHRSPRFAEAYNQRAIAYYGLKRFPDSAADCRRVIERNPFHIGALSGLGKCYIEMGLRDEALAAYRRAYELQPFDDDLKSTIQVLEAAGR